MEFESITIEKLIISLIKDDLINIRLVDGLEALGLDSGKYYLHLSETIFNLMDIQNQETLFEEHTEFCKKVKDINIFEYPDALDELALEIYNKLMASKKS